MTAALRCQLIAWLGICFKTVIAVTGYEHVPTVKVYYQFSHVFLLVFFLYHLWIRRYQIGFWDFIKFCSIPNGSTHHAHLEMDFWHLKKTVVNVLVKAIKRSAGPFESIPTIYDGNSGVLRLTRQRIQTSSITILERVPCGTSIKTEAILSDFCNVNKKRHWKELSVHNAPTTTIVII